MIPGKEEALGVVLTLDQDPLEVDQYEVTDFDAEEPEKIGFMESSSPELHDTVDHEPVEIHADDVGEEIKNVTKLEFTKTDPFDEVPEPVPGKKQYFHQVNLARLTMICLDMLAVQNYHLYHQMNCMKTRLISL